MKAFDYNQIAGSYDQWYATPLGKQIDEWEKKLFLLHLEKLATRNILEIGAGTGHWTQFLSSNGFTVTGIDVAEKMLEQAHKKNIPNASFQAVSAEELPFDNASIENVIAITSLEFIENQEKAVSEIFRVLKPGGHFIIGGLNAQASLQKSRQSDPVFKNARFFTPKSLFQLLEKFGTPTVEGCVYMPNPQAELEEIINTENIAPINLLNIYGNFLVGSVKRTINQDSEINSE